MITKQQATEQNGIWGEKHTQFQHKYQKNADGTPLRARRNGRTRIWKKQPERFRIPIKIGLYGYGEITEKNCNHWEVAK